MFLRCPWRFDLRQGASGGGSGLKLRHLLVAAVVCLALAGLVLAHPGGHTGDVASEPNPSAQRPSPASSSQSYVGLRFQVEFVMNDWKKKVIPRSAIGTYLISGESTDWNLLPAQEGAAYDSFKSWQDSVARPGEFVEVRGRIATTGPIVTHAIICTILEKRRGSTVWAVIKREPEHTGFKCAALTRLT